MKLAALLAVMVVVAISTVRVAGDPDLLQDFCVADLASGTKVNGFACKNPVAVTADDFFFGGLATPAATNTTMGSAGTAANVLKIPGLNTLGISMTRIDFAPGGLSPPHVHPRATEMIFVLEGELNIGFITTTNVLFTKLVTAGEAFVIPRGLVHYLKNDGLKPAAVIASFNSQMPGTLLISLALFTSTPPVPDHVLTTAFQIGTKEVEAIRRKLSPK
ncbi:hypothetical protein Droror1_Dr00011102 [Drosera rotundifolia]